MKLSTLLKLSCLFMLICGLPSCDRSDNSKFDKNKKNESLTGTQRMVARLQEIAANANPEMNGNLNNARAALLISRLQTTSDPGQSFQLHFYYAMELLNAGRSKEAITEFQNLIQQGGINVDEISKENKLILEMLALANLRLGEQENCILNHSGEACILPLTGKGFHQHREGSQKARDLYEILLNQFPDDLNSIWLLNVANMTLGEFPDSVPGKFRLPVSTFLSRGRFPKFQNIADQIGVDLDGIAGGCCIEDFNNDGFLDIISSSWGLTDQMHILINNGDGTFSDRTKEAGLTGLLGGLNMIHADYNNDGFADVLVLRGAWLGKAGNIPNSLIKNNGDGTFSDVTYESGIYSEHPTQTAGWADINLDGWLDLFIGNESRSENINACELFISNRDGTFTESAAKYELNVVGFVKGCNWGDVNNDMRPDLYLSLLGEKNKLFINRSGAAPDEFVFEEIGESAGVQEPLKSFPAWFWDYDNDGFDDIWVCGYDNGRFEFVGEDEVRTIKGMPAVAELPRLYHNNGDETFTDLSLSLGVSKVMYAMGSNFEDINNDGFLDFYLGTGAPDLRSIVPNRMFLNQNGKSFSDITNDGGFGHIQKGHAVAFGDMDNDGDQDIYADIGGAFEGDLFRNAFFENPGTEGNWMVIQLEGKKSNRSAIGASIQFIILEGGLSRSIFRTVGTGGSFGSSSLQVELGIGEAEQIEKVIVTWPNQQKTVQVFENIITGKKYLLIENEALKELPFRKIIWKQSASHSHEHS